jgi:acetylornithine deacetylase/succinyl-diaminopimelate desuccinylase-like protein
MIEDYLAFLRFKSISADPAYKEECLACAKWLEAFLKDIGFKTALWPTVTNPTLFAEDLSAGIEAPTLLFYQHYDVQPVDPLDLWESDPFEPKVVGDTIIARGAQDNKGQCFYVLSALKSYKEKHGRFPVNIKVIIEGDEEMGSAGLKGIVKQHAHELKADYLLITDLGITSMDKPAITLGTRGLITMEMTVQGSARDLHSGDMGGIVYNPLHALVEMLSQARDAKGHITIPGFYDDVRSLKEDLDFTWDDKVAAGGGECHDFSPFERAWLRPTLEINGITGGYSGPGFKTVIPALASAKLSCRLVPGQDPTQIFDRLYAFFMKIQPKSVTVTLTMLNDGSPAVRTSASSLIAQAALSAYAQVFGKPAGKIMSGGTIGIAGPLAAASGAETLFLGLGLSEDQIHAPNERFSISRIEKGQAIICHILDYFKES